MVWGSAISFTIDRYKWGLLLHNLDAKSFSSVLPQFVIS